MKSVMGSTFAEITQAQLDAQARPPGSLPLIDRLIGFLAEAQQTPSPDVQTPRVLIFAGDHGVARTQSVSAYPSGVTPLMAKTILQGKATVNVLAQQAGASLELIDVGIATPLTHPGALPDGVFFRSAPIAAGTRDLSVEPAMTSGQVQSALTEGAAAVARAINAGVDLIALGELGIGNTTTAAGVAAQLLRVSPLEVAGPGTGLDPAGVQRKAALLQKAMDRHPEPSVNPIDALAELGGFEVAAMTGALLQAARHHLPVLIDGFVVGAAALAAVRINPEVQRVIYPATRSAEPGHQLLLDTLGLPPPVFDAGFRLGEASAATLAIPLVKAACAVFHGTALLKDVMPQ